MQGICSNFFFVFSVIDLEIAKTVTSFLAFQGNYLHSDFLFTDITFDVTQVLGLVLILICYLGSINLSG